MQLKPGQRQPKEQHGDSRYTSQFCTRRQLMMMTMMMIMMTLMTTMTDDDDDSKCLFKECKKF